VGDWSQGVPLAWLRNLCGYWADGYDWRRCEARLNALAQYRTEIDGIAIYFLHVRSPVPDAVPLIITHGWPGSVIEFLKVIRPLTDPAAHGLDPADAFDVVCPSLPGYAFSGKPAAPGWGIAKIAAAWAQPRRTPRQPDALLPPRGGHFAAFEQPEQFASEVRSSFRLVR
jgi:epoxide hydrolase